MAAPRSTTGEFSDRLRSTRMDAEQYVQESRQVVQRAPTPVQILMATFRDFSKHADGVHAGALGFFGTLSVFPLVLLTIVLFSKIIRMDAATKLVFSQLGTLLPEGDTVAGVASANLNIPAAVVGGSLFALLWSSLGAFVTLGYSLDRAWDREGDRNIIVRYLVAATLSLAVGATMITASLLITAARSTDIALGAAYWLVESLVAWAAIVLLYRLVPDARVGWAETLLPAALVTVACGVARFGFGWYLGNVAQIGRIYGPMANVAGLMLWLLVTSAVLLWGAELSHQLSQYKSRSP
jgi:membrane protein